MRIIKDNPAFDKPREEIRKYFKSGKLLFCADIHLSFVCGAGEREERSLREEFISFVNNSDEVRLVCIKAEEASIDLLRQVEERANNRSLSVFESAIAQTSDSVLIFPESPGSFAELGFFSAFEDIRKKSLVVLEVNHQDPSFINLGPVGQIAAVSMFGPQIVIGEDQAATFRAILRRLLGEMSDKRPYRRRFEVKGLKDYSSRQVLSILDEIIALTGIVTEADLREILHSIFKGYDISQLRLLLSILSATGRLVRNLEGDLACFQTNRLMDFIEGDSESRVRIKAIWRDAYAEHLPEALEDMESLQQ